MTSPGNKRHAHPAEEILADLAEDRVDSALKAGLVEHVQSCGRCRKRFEAVSALLQKLKGGRLESPPDWLSAWVADLPRSHPKRVSRPVRSTLSLIFDSLVLRPVGVRSQATRPRRLVFRQGNVDIDIEVEVRRGGSVALRGQILDASVPGGRKFDEGTVLLKSGRSVTARAQLSELGLFHIPSLESGLFSLSIESRGFSCRIPSLEI